MKNKSTQLTCALASVGKPKAGLSCLILAIVYLFHWTDSRAQDCTASISPGDTVEICSGSSVTLTASPGTAYLWSTGQTTQSIDFAGSNQPSAQLNLSISGEGYFVLQNFNNETVYTRDGQFSLDGSGNIIHTLTGYFLQGRFGFGFPQDINITTYADSLNITQEGYVQALLSGQTEYTNFARIVLAGFSNPGGLIYLGNNIYQISKSSGLAKLSDPGSGGTGLLSHNFIVSVDVTDDNGCIANASVIIVFNPAPATPIITASGATSFCKGGEVTLDAGTGYNSYLWSNGDTSQLITVNASGNYTVTVSDSSGCSAVSDAVSVKVLDANITPSGTISICEGSQLVLTADSADSYLWNTGDTSAALSVLTAGDYYVVETYNSLCELTSEIVTVNINPLPAVTIAASGATSFCEGDSVFLDAGNFSSYQWSTGDTSATLSVQSSGVYYVTVTDANGCSASVSSDYIDVLTAPDATITPAGTVNICEGTQINLTAGSADYYLWSTGETGYYITVTTEGGYSVTMTNGNGCSRVSETTTIDFIQPTINPNGTINICQGEQVTLTADSADSYNWNTGETTRSITVNYSGTFYTLLFSNFGCAVLSEMVTVNVNPAPPVYISPYSATSFCEGGSVELDAGAGYVSYLWSNGETAQIITATLTGNYTVTITDANGCNAISDPLPVEVLATPGTAITPNGTITLCEGATLTAGIADNYYWNTGQTEQTIIVTATGDYYAYLFNNNGCAVYSETVTVTVIPLSTVYIINYGVNPFCENDSTILEANAGFSSYLWNTGETTQTISAKVAGDYYVTATDANGCAAVSPPVNIATISLPVADAGQDTTIFSEQSVQIGSEAISGNTYSWSPTDGLSDPNIANPLASPAGTTTYTLAVTDGSGCNATDEVTINVMPPGSACASAISLTPSVVYNSTGFTMSGTEMWFSFVADSTNIRIYFNSFDTTFINGQIELLSGNCGSLNTLESINFSLTESMINLPDVITGSVYFLKITSSPNSTFAVCINNVIPQITTSCPNPLPCDLICNGNFEDRTFCPFDWSQLFFVKNWINPNAATPDYWACTVLPIAGVPYNMAGCQSDEPSNNAYAGIFMYGTGGWGNAWREYVQQEMTSSMIAGKTYFIKISVSLAEVSSIYADGIQVRFSDNQITKSDYSVLPWGTGIKLTGTKLLNDKSEWVELCGVYTATGGEKWITIGNFGGVTFTVGGIVSSTGCSVGNSTNCYYYIDDVSVHPLDPLWQTQTICKDESITIGPSSCILPNATYSWTPATGLNNPGIANPVASPASTTNYQLTITTNNNCTFISSWLVNVKGPDITLTANNTCGSYSITANVTGSTSPYYYQWNTGEATSNIAVSASGTYSVTVYDADGCTATDETTLDIMPAVLAITPSPVSICAGQSVTLTASGANSYSWSNSQTTPSISVSPAATTTYTVTGFGADLSCLGTASVTVTVDNPIVPGFTFDEFDNCEHQSVTFTANTGNAAYTWDFGDGPDNGNPVTTTTNPYTHTYTIPGYFQVTLSASNACGSTVSPPQVIYIVPSIGAYNSNCCMKDFIYSFPLNDNIDVTGSGTVNTSWNIKGTLTIKSGVTWTIGPGAVFGFGPQGKVIVEPGATLIIDGGTLTSVCFNTCSPPIRMMWQGIEVWGNSSAGSLAAQGKLILKNGATIEDAHNAVTLGKWQLVPFTTGHGFQYNAHVISAGGGVIRASASLTATNANFNRNAVSIRFWDYKPVNFSQVVKSNFTCREKTCSGSLGGYGSLLDPYYNVNKAPEVYYDSPILAHNPFYSYIVLTSGSGTIYPVPHISVESPSLISIYQANVTGVLFRDNFFDLVGTGMYSVDSRYNVSKFTTGSSVNNTFTGILIQNTNNSGFGHNISDNTFNSSSWAIDGYGDNFLRINKNTINGLPPGWADGGIKLTNSYNFSVTDNTFNNITGGVQVYNSGIAAASLIGFKNSGNTFIENRHAIRTYGNNSLLTIRCNSHNNQNSQEYIRNWYIYNGSLPNQGQFSATDEKKPAGNRFSITNSSIRKEIKTSVPFSYFAHWTPADRIPVADGPVNINPNSIASSSFQNSCTPLVSANCNPCNKQAMAEYSAALIQLQASYTSVLNNLDKGQTLQLLSAISSNMPVGNLKNLLLSKSPLSDTVLISVINRGSPLPAGIFKDIIIPNSPVSDAVKEPLEQQLQTLPPGIIQQILNAQSINPGYTTLTSIAREITQVEISRQMSLNNLMGNYIDSNYIDSAKIFLQNEKYLEAKQALIGLYLDDSSYTEAAALLSTLPINTDEEMTYFNLYSMYIDLGLAGKTLWQMDTVQIQLVRDIAAMCPASLAVINARAILRLVFGEETPACPDNLIARMASNNNNDVFIENNSADLVSRQQVWNIYPNPNDGTMQLDYSLLPGEKGNLCIFDITGKKIIESELVQGENSLSIDGQKIMDGIYFYQVKVNGQIITSEKLIIIK